MSGLDDTESHVLLRDAGELTADDADRLVEWAGEYPFALTLARDRLRSGTITPQEVPHDPAIAQRIIEHLAGGPVVGTQYRQLLTAAIAASVDENALRAAVPEAPAGMDWLRAVPCIEVFGARLRIRDGLRGVLGRCMSILEPGHAVVIRTRLADHFVRQALAGDPRALTDICALLQDPRLMPALDQLPGLTPQITTSVEGDVGLLTRCAYPPEAAAAAHRWFDSAPEFVTVVRSPDETDLAWLCAVSLSNHPAWAAEDPVVGPWIEFAQHRHPDGDAFFVRDIHDFTDARDPVAAMLAWAHTWLLRGMGVTRERYCYYAIRSGDPTQERIRAWLEATGHVRPDGLSSGTDDDREYWLLDYGEGGLVAHVWRLVYRELGVRLPYSVPGGDLSRVVREALRGLHDSAALATSPLARGAGSQVRAEYVRALIARAVADEFAASAADQELQRVLQLSYLAPDTPVPQILRTLSISRATYYRRLDEAVRRLAAHLD